MISEYIAYRIGKRVEHNEHERRCCEKYPNGKPAIDWIIESIAFVVVLIFVIVIWIGS